MDCDDGPGRRARGARGTVGGRFLTRRRYLGSLGVATSLGLAGCTTLTGGGTTTEKPTLADFRGSGPLVEDRPRPGGTPMADLPALSGELTVYLGGGEGGEYTELIELFERAYPDFDAHVRTDASSSLANTIIEETTGGGSPADVFFSVDAGSLGAVADAGATTPLPQNVLEPVSSTFESPDGDWVGVAGRARTIPYNTDTLSASDVPEHVRDVPSAPFADSMGWAPTYGAFQSFVTAMRLLDGPERTKQWLTAMNDQGVESYPNEFLVSNAVADGEIAAGFANHYYALRVKSSRPDAPIELAFTKNDAGALVNVAGAALVAGGQKQTLAANFVRHLLSAEAQEFFATVTFGYPVIAGVAPVGGLPTIDDLDPPALDLTALGDLQPTLDLMREVGVL